jgi:hypothetical protein
LENGLFVPKFGKTAKANFSGPRTPHPPHPAIKIIIK